MGPLFLHHLRFVETASDRETPAFFLSQQCRRSWAERRLAPLTGEEDQRYRVAATSGRRKQHRGSLDSPTITGLPEAEC